MVVHNNPSTWKQGWKNCLFGASLGDQKILICLPFSPGKNNKIVIRMGYIIRKSQIERKPKGN